MGASSPPAVQPSRKRDTSKKPRGKVATAPAPAADWLRAACHVMFHPSPPVSGKVWGYMTDNPLHQSVAEVGLPKPLSQRHGEGPVAISPEKWWLAPQSAHNSSHLPPWLRQTSTDQPYPHSLMTRRSPLAWAWPSGYRLGCPVPGSEWSFSKSLVDTDQNVAVQDLLN